jgi:hypothetical protein
VKRTENPCVPSSILGGATNKNKGLRQKRDPFFMSDIDYNVTTKPPETPLFEVIYYNPYYNFHRSFLRNKKTESKWTRF